MSTSLARKIRRIGLLPSLSLSDVMDPNQQTKLKDAHDRLDNAKERQFAADAKLEAIKKGSVKASEVERTAAKQASSEADAAVYSAQKALDELLTYLNDKLDSKRRQRLPLTEEELKAEADKLTKDAQAKRAANREVAAKASASRVAKLKKAFAPKVA